jgi:hypothetical protein
MNEAKPASDCTGPSSCSALQVEAWECCACGKEVPCRVQITHYPTKYSHVERQPRFTSRNRGCICDNSPVSDWKRVPNAGGEN